MNNKGKQLLTTFKLFFDDNSRIQESRFDIFI